MSLSQGVFQEVGRIGETRVQIGQDLEQRDVIRLVWPSGEIGLMALANLLAGSGERVEMEGGQRWTTAEIYYTEAVDRRLVTLLDVLAELRVRAGRYVQLEMELTASEAEELEQVLEPVGVTV